MLIDFSFSNYKSYRHDQQFTMRSYKRGRDGANGHVLPDTVSAAAVYGSNASGKSAFIDALSFASNLVRNGLASGSRSGIGDRKPFALDSTGSCEPTGFLFDFSVDGGRRYLYEFSVDDAKVLYEELRVYTAGNRTARLYEREDENGAINLVFGRQFEGRKQSYKQLLKENVLFLSVLGAVGNKQLSSVFGFLAGIGTYPAQNFRHELAGISHLMKEDGVYKEALSLLIKHSGFGVTRLSTDKDAEKEVMAMASRKDSRHRIFKNVLRGYSLVNDPSMDERERETALAAAIAQIEGGSTIAGKLLFLHQGSDGECYLNEEDESRGTLAAVSFLSLALRSLSSYHLLLVDEIDTSLHPSYVQEFVELFTDENTNPHHSQLIFTTHDASLITKSGADIETMPLKRDQIWLTEKNKFGESELVPVTSFGVRETENIGRNYLNGVYGALPASDLHRVFAGLISFLDSEALGHHDG